MLRFRNGGLCEPFEGIEGFYALFRMFRGTLSVCSQMIFMHDMKKALVALFGWSLLSGLAFGDYPRPKAILRHLLGKDSDAGKHFKDTFNSVRQYAESARRIGESDPRILIGEEDDCIEWPKNQRRWRWFSQIDSSFKVLIDGVYVFHRSVIDELVKEYVLRRQFCPSGTNEETWLYPEGDEEVTREKQFTSVREMLKTLTSKIFMERLLGEDTVKAFLKVRQGFATQVRTRLSPDSLQPFRQVGVFLEYLQVEEFTKHTEEKGDKISWFLRVGFHAVWDAEADRFADNEVRLSSFLAGNLHLSPKVENRYLLTNGQLGSACGICSLPQRKTKTEKRPKSCRSEKSVPSRKPKEQNKVVVS